MKSSITAENITKTFQTGSRGRLEAVKAVNFECYPGKIFGLLGPNGAGKTTTLRMLATILKPTRGTAKVNDYDVIEYPEAVRKSIGFLATETGLYDGLTPRETLTFFGKVNGLGQQEIAERTDNLFQVLNMEGYKDRRVGKLSSGMRQKLSLARSIVHDPPVLIFDEPTTGLDVMTAHTVMEYINYFREEGKTIVISTHQMRVAEKLCDRIGILFEGQIRDEGSLEELLSRHDAENLEDVFFSLAEGEE